MKIFTKAIALHRRYILKYHQNKKHRQKVISFSYKGKYVEVGLLLRQCYVQCFNLYILTHIRYLLAQFKAELLKDSPISNMSLFLLG